MEETWRPVPNYEDRYEVSSHGRIRSSYRGIIRILRQEHHYRGYLRIMLSRHQQTERFFMHRLIAQVFLPNPNAHPYVNHKDRNKENNRIDNLEWISPSDNTRHWMDDKAAQGIPIRTPVVVEQHVFADSDLPFD